MVLVGAAVGVALALVAVLIPWLPPADSAEALKIDDVYWFVTIICIVIFALVAGVSLYAVWKFRAAPDDTDDGAPIHGHTGLEVVWTAVPAALVTAITIYSGIVLNQIDTVPKDHRVVEVTGQQFAWSFHYPDSNVTSGVLALPIGQTTELKLQAKDVIHSFWVPEWRMKEDAVPGITTNVLVTPTKEGTFTVICTELCGLGHAVMRAQALVFSRPTTRSGSRTRRPRRQPRARRPARRSSPSNVARVTRLRTRERRGKWAQISIRCSRGRTRTSSTSRSSTRTPRLHPDTSQT